MFIWLQKVSTYIIYSIPDVLSGWPKTEVGGAAESDEKSFARRNSVILSSSSAAISSSTINLFA